MQKSNEIRDPVISNMIEIGRYKKSNERCGQRYRGREEKMNDMYVHSFYRDTGMMRVVVIQSKKAYRSIGRPEFVLLRLHDNRLYIVPTEKELGCKINPQTSGFTYHVNFTLPPEIKYLFGDGNFHYDKNEDEFYINVDSYVNDEK